jgi:hypothetical protein
VGLARDLILGNDADRRIARPLVSKCSIGGNFRAHAMEGVSVQVWNRSWSLSWARELTKLGHQVQLMPAKDVKAYVKRNRRRGDLRGRTTSDHAFCAGQIGLTAEPVDAASDARSFTATIRSRARSTGVIPRARARGQVRQGKFVCELLLAGRLLDFLFIHFLDNRFDEFDNSAIISGVVCSVSMFGLHARVGVLAL